MLTTVPKVPVSTKTRYVEKRKFHTIHLVENIFTIQNNGTSIVSFRHKSDAINLGKMLESHFDITQEWPIINFEDSLFLKQTKVNRLKYLNLKSWEEEKLKEFCLKNNFNMLDIFSFESDFRLVGRSIFWEKNNEYYINLLNNKINEC